MSLQTEALQRERTPHSSIQTASAKSAIVIELGPRTKSKPEVTFITPVFNEAGTLTDVIQRLQEAVRPSGYSYEIIVIDDGSKDDTKIRMAGYAQFDSHVRFISNGKNMGKGFALRVGFSHALGERIVWLDGDGEIDARQVGRFAGALAGGADLVIASKWHPLSRVEMPIFRKILSRGYNTLVRLLTGLPISDTQTGLKAIRKDALMSMLSGLTVKRYAFDVELLLLARLQHLKIMELPVSVKLNGSFSLREIWRMFLDLLRITYRLRVLRWYQTVLRNDLTA